ncbi:unnamed protein product, partial [Rotaria sp. Silwood2]
LVGYQILVHHNEQRVLLHPVQILYDERMKDISVMEIPSEQQRARQLMLATAFSALHTKSTSEYINKLVWYVEFKVAQYRFNFVFNMDLGVHRHFILSPIKPIP